MNQTQRHQKEKLREIINSPSDITQENEKASR